MTFWNTTALATLNCISFMELEMSLVVYTHMAFWILSCFDLIYFKFFSSYKLAVIKDYESAFDAVEMFIQIP